MNRIFFALTLLVAASCTPSTVDQKPDMKQPPSKLVLTETSFAALPSWGSDDFKGFVSAFQKSCTRILKNAPDKKFGALAQSGTYGDWQPACRSFANVAPANLKTFFENRFTPYQVSDNGKAEGLFTGYYEASLRGSKTRTGPYQTPLYARADDLVMVQLGDFREGLKGQRIAGRIVDGRLKPYETRAEIVDGKWPHNDKVLVWVDSAVDAFFVQIQGSGIVEMSDGAPMRIGYAGQNGHPYYAIGKELIERGALNKESVSMQSIRNWLESHPDEADEIMNTNQSYVFFRKLDGEGPIGGEGIALTAERSLAIDRSLLSYGMPVWTDIAHPDPAQMPLQKLMVAQDTGGAIRGPVRGDVFWGYGQAAERLAGPMKSKGRYWVLLPN